MMKNRILSLLMIVSAPVLSQVYDTQVPPLPGEQFKKANYRIWLPEGVDNIKGIIFRQHGCGLGASSTGLAYANDLQWQSLAQKHSMALMGSELENDKLCAQWTDPEAGSERAFLQALKDFSRMTGHAEIDKVPWALFGHSGGAYWCTNMLFKYPERILVVVNRSGGISTLKWNPDLLKVPVLWVAGEYDSTATGLNYAKDLTIKSFLGYRQFGAPWSVAIDPKAGHGNRLGRSFYIPYMDTMLSLRLSENGYSCRDLNSNQEWLGNFKTGEIISGDSAKEKNTWVWLPSKEVAEKWKEYVTTGWVTDKTAPPPPTDLSMRNHQNEKVLEWKQEIDLESGIKEFKIYRNGELFFFIEGQTPNYGDVAVPADIKFSCKVKKSGNYSVTAVNHAGLESQLGR